MGVHVNCTRKHIQPFCVHNFCPVCRNIPADANYFTVRNANYVNAGLRQVANGGLRFNPSGRNGSMVLVGDSFGSMYGKLAAGIARERDLRLTVISVAGEDPLPRSAGRPPALWLQSLAIVQREKPDFLLLACNWKKLSADRNRLALALQHLGQSARSVILITQPPELPPTATRQAIRNGHRAPFLEDPAERTARIALNAFVKSFQRDNVTVVDIEPLFSRSTGEIRFVDDRGNQLYYDSGHLSAIGANLVRTPLLNAMLARRSLSGSCPHAWEHDSRGKEPAVP